MAKGKTAVETPAIELKIVIEPKHYIVEIVGDGGLLMNRQPDMSVPKIKATKQVKEDPLVAEHRDWRKKLYSSDTLGVFIPGECIHECLKQGAKYWGAKIPGEGNKTYADIVKCGITVEDMPLGNGSPLSPEDEHYITPFGKNVNGTPTKPNPALVYKIRPKIEPWGGKVRVTVYDTGRLNEDVLKTLFAYAGAFKGLLDWRPTYGRFKLASLSEEA